MTDIEQFKLRWVDSGIEPKCPSDPAYPNGMELDLSRWGEPACRLELPYPAPRIGHYEIECRLCKIRTVCTTAGRRDDPCAIVLACRTH